MLFRTVNVISSGATPASPYTATGVDDVIVVNKTIASASQITLPTSLTGRRYSIKDGKGDSAVNTITIVGTAVLIDGSSSVILNVPYGAVDLVFDGTQWRVI